MNVCIYFKKFKIYVFKAKYIHTFIYLKQKFKKYMFANCFI